MKKQRPEGVADAVTRPRAAPRHPTAHTPLRRVVAGLGPRPWRVAHESQPNPTPKKKAGASGELAPAYSEVAIPVAKAMNKFVNEDYRQALDGLLPVQGSLWRMGGSIAQRDLIEWTLLETAIRAGEGKIAGNTSSPDNRKTSSDRTVDI